MATILRGFCTLLAVAGILAVSMSVGGCGALNSMGDAVGHGIASRMLAKHVGQPSPTAHREAETAKAHRG